MAALMSIATLLLGLRALGAALTRRRGSSARDLYERRLRAGPRG